MVEVENVAVGKFRKRFSKRFCSQMCSDKKFLELVIHPVFIELTRMTTDVRYNKKVVKNLSRLNLY